MSVKAVPGPDPAAAPVSISKKRRRALAIAYGRALQSAAYEDKALFNQLVDGLADLIDPALDGVVALPLMLHGTTPEEKA